MSEAYERERQNNSRLDELASKVTALRGVTIDIYDSARQQDVIDSTVRWSPKVICSTQISNLDLALRPWFSTCLLLFL